MRSLLASFFLSLLGACTAFGTRSGSGAAPAQDWPAFGVEVQVATFAERESLRAVAVANQAAGNLADSAIQLALLELGSGNGEADFELAIEWLDAAATAADVDADDLDFITFIHPILTRLAAQQVALATARTERDALRAQLEALRQLEEEIDASE